MKAIILAQDNVLKVLAGRANDYCLGGGTALAKVYFHHRFSFDLDFFVLDFSRTGIISLMDSLSGLLKKKISLVSEQSNKKKVRLIVFSVILNRTEALKIDFIEDYIPRLKPVRRVDGINVFALEDIFLRKIYAVSGTVESVDASGRQISIGGRQEAKDFFDLYFLSRTFMNLSDFAFKYCDISMREAIVRWFRTYPRLDIKAGLLELKTKNKIDYKEMEKHFECEIGRILERQIGRL